MNPYDWPSGEFLWSLCKTIDDNGQVCGIGFHNTSTSISVGEKCQACLNTGNDVSPSPHIEKIEAKVSMPDYWKASARRAMLDKFGYSTFDHLVDGSRNDNGKDSRKFPLLPDEVCAVQRRWMDVIKEINDKQNNPCSDNITIPGSDDNLDFIDFVTNRSCKSNERQLQWSIMSCPRGVQFPLHAHPNLELIYCIRGTLYEIRMNGEPITRSFKEDETGSEELRDEKVLVGPTLTDIKRSWSFDTLQAGQWLVNEVGSIHKSFTSARSDGGCDLLVLWGGSHANIRHPPISPNVQNAVDFMDGKLHTDSRNLRNDVSCCSKNDTISELFLPDSERFSKN
jgi:hypothetical protein